MERKNTLQLDFSGGMNTVNTPMTLRDNESELILNYRLNRYGGLQKRFGMTDAGAEQEVGDYPILAIGGGVTRAGTTFIHTNGTIYEWAGSSWTSRISSVGNARPASFAYMVGSASPADPGGYTFFNGAGGTYMQSSDSGTSWGDSNCPDSTKDFRPYFLEQHGLRMYAARTGSQEVLVYFSSAAVPSGDIDVPADDAEDEAGQYDELTWDLENDWINVDLRRDDGAAPSLASITGLKESDGRLYIFTGYRMVRYDQTAGQEIVADHGAWYNTLIANNDKYGLLFFAGPEGVFAYSPYEGRPRCISTKIRRIYHELVADYADWVDTINNKWGSMATTGDELFIRPNVNITYDGKTITNPVLCYNIPLDAWTILSFNKEITCMYRAENEDFGSDIGKEIFVGTDDGYVMQLQDASATTDYGSVPIASEVRSKEFLLNLPNLAAVDEIDVLSIENGRTQVFFDVDRKGDFLPAGEVTGRFSSHPTRRSPKCHSTRIKLTSNDNAASIIEGYNIAFTQYDYEHGK